ncbi:MFS transporter [Brucella intermedia]|uniref:MFS transporter n=1 Tax=Brucella intermedia TaxID=94625 RepID=UPI00224A6309|nr:MFS transporter [Brucella intermedia]
MTPVLDSAVGKCTRRLLPFIVLMYTMAFLDRANVGFAKQAFQIDTGLSDAAFAFGAGIFFIGYALFEIPSNIILQRVGAKIWMCRIMVTWGLVAAAMMFAHNETIFYVLRFLLGVTEAGFFPGVILYLTYWFPERSRGKATGYFYFGVPLALVVGGPISGFLLEWHGLAGLAGWQWMFLIEGLAAAAVGVWAFFWLDDRPRDAQWLSTDERAAIEEQLKSEDAAKVAHAPSGMFSSLTDGRALYLTLTFFFVQIAAYGLIFYLPVIVSGYLGVKVGLEVGIITAIPWIVSLVGIYYLTSWSDRTGNRHSVVTLSYLALAISLVASAYLGTVLGVAALCVAAAAYCGATPLFWTICTKHLSNSSAATGIALIGAVGNLGGFVAPNLKAWVEGNFGPQASMIAIAATALISAIMVFAIRGSGNAEACGPVYKPQP